MAKATLTTGQVISLGDGRFACEVDEIYTALNTLLDDNLFTHQLPRGAKYVQRTIIDACPWVKDLPEIEYTPREPKATTVKKWVVSISEKVGETHEIPDASEGWGHKHPLVELAEMVTKDN